MEKIPTSCVLMVCVNLLVCSKVVIGGNFSALIAFGDSILDTGNNNNLLTTSKCNFPPYGMSLPAKLPTGRFGNGKVFSDVLCEKLGIKDYVPAYLSSNLKDSDLPTGVCFASGGSGLDDRTANFQGVIPLGRQLDSFKEYLTKLRNYVGESKANAIINNALFLISSGNNDLGLTYYSFRLRPTYNVFTYTEKLTPLAADFVKQIYQLGARKIAYMSTLPLGCLPSARLLAGEVMCNEFVNQGTKYFNSRLESTINDLAKTLPDAQLFFLDVYNPLLNIIRNPQASGFLVPNIGCCCAGLIPCPDVTKNIFWDYAHPTEKAYRIMIDNILEDPKYAGKF